VGGSREATREATRDTIYIVSLVSMFMGNETVLNVVPIAMNQYNIQDGLIPRECKVFYSAGNGTVPLFLDDATFPLTLTLHIKVQPYVQ